MNAAKCTVLILILALFLNGCTNKPAIDSDPIDFRLDTLDHQRFYLNQYRGKTVVLVFWATWCIPCKKELIALNDYTGKPEFSDVVFAGVCYDPEDLDDVKRIVKTLNISYTVLLDNQTKVAEKLGVKAVPTTVVINPKSEISLKEEGYDVETMQKIMKHVQQLVSADKN